MVTAEHEALHKIFQHDTELFARTMRHVFAVRVPVPRHVSIMNTDFTEVRPHLRRGDSVLLAELLVEDPDNQYVMIIESQTDPDDEKAYRWPYYVAYLHDKYQCPVVLLVVCSKAGTAEWAREPIVVGLPGLLCMTVRAIVLGPDNVPTITDLAMARDDVGFAVFSALTHSRSERVGVILETLAAALGTIDAETASLLAEFTEAGLGSTDGVTIWRGLMATQTYPYVSHLRSQGREEGRQEGLAEGRSEGRAEGRSEGRAEGRAEARAADIVRLLDKRGIEMAPADRELVLACRDAETLDVWLDRVLTISRISELFAA
jgi:hypothetical protein